MDTCNWTQEDEGSEVWYTSCINIFSFTEPGPINNGMKFCCFCGKPLNEVQWEEPEDDEDDEDSE